MKKNLALLLVLMLVLALPTAAQAIDLPGGKITVTAQPVDYVSALAGIAKPASKTYAENERYALLVSIDVPIYMDTADLELRVDPKGCTVDSLDGMTLMTGKYLIFGTALTPGATVKITVKDMALTNAATAGQLWEAVYHDRTVSATATLGTAASQTVMGIPKTGGRASVAGAALCLLLAAAVYTCVRLRCKSGRNRHA